MKPNYQIIAACILIFSLLLLSCGVQQLPTTIPGPNSTLTPTKTLTPSPTITPSPIPSNTPIPTSTPMGGGSGKLVFSLIRADYVSNFPDLKGSWNVFTMNVNGTDLTPVTNGIFEKNFVFIHDISPNGHQALIQTGRADSYGGIVGDMYIVNLDGSGIINLHNDSFYSGVVDASRSPSYWLTDGKKIVYLAVEGDERYIFIANSDGSNSQPLTKPGSYPNDLIPTSDDLSVYWAAGCPGRGTNYRCGYRKTSLDTLEEKEIESVPISDDLSPFSKINRSSCSPCEFFVMEGIVMVYSRSIFIGTFSRWK